MSIVIATAESAAAVAAAFGVALAGAAVMVATEPVAAPCAAFPTVLPSATVAATAATIGKRNKRQNVRNLHTYSCAWRAGCHPGKSEPQAVVSNSGGVGGVERAGIYCVLV